MSDLISTSYLADPSRRAPNLERVEVRYEVTLAVAALRDFGALVH